QSSMNSVCQQSKRRLSASCLASVPPAIDSNVSWSQSHPNSILQDKNRLLQIAVKLALSVKSLCPLQFNTYGRDYAVSEYRTGYVVQLKFSGILFDPNQNR
ncbi:MAG: hypothetical protein KDB27_32580, partial [Planctomycetales bacterium]|nr:hypothetical protein [Planctomycetales bacterium]